SQCESLWHQCSLSTPPLCLRGWVSLLDLLEYPVADHDSGQPAGFLPDVFPHSAFLLLHTVYDTVLCPCAGL
ncbi:MAG: hypothetical protein AAB314_02515, partial [Nitrospirota bacterium]